MQIKLYRTALIVIAALVIIASGAAIYYTVGRENRLNESMGRETQFMYYLKEHDEKIGVFRVNEDTPFMTLEVYVDSLPYIDRVALSEGIEVSDDNKLKVLMEDYES